MSDVSPSVLFEHPLNEKMRTWLRMEFLLQQLHGQRALSETAIALTFFRTIADLLDVLQEFCTPQSVTLDDLLTLLPACLPRAYSIASAARGPMFRASICRWWISCATS